MEPVGKIAKKYSPQAQQQHSTATTGNAERRLPKPIIAALFVRIKVIYGPSWANRFSNENEMHVALVEWATALAKYTQSEINTALASWSHHNPDWAPTLGQFERCCEEAYKHAKPEQKKLSAPRSSRERKNEYLEKIRQYIPIKTTTTTTGGAA